MLRKTGNERFINNNQEIEFSILDFWQWSNSDLLNNSTRGKLAEFIVAMDLGITDKIRQEWESYDLITSDGIKIEVKTSGYLQSWNQVKDSEIRFRIRPTLFWDSNTNTYDKESKRQSDYYVFCVLIHKDKDTVDPINLNQWEFYVIKTITLDEKFGEQKSINLSKLLKLNPLKCKFGEIRKIINS